MRQAQQQVRRNQTAQTLAVPAPVGGLNARDALASMPEGDAVTLDNFFPEPTSVSLRKGYTKWATGLPAHVESLMNYRSATADKMFAASGTAFYDVSAQGAVGAAVVTGLTNARWQHLNMGTAGGQFLVCVNGTDTARIYNGTSWMTYAATSTAQTISSITNVTTTATLTTAAPHGLATGNQVVISGATAAAYNGTFIITVTGASAFTYTMLSDPGGAASVVGTYTVGFAITGVASTALISANLFKFRLFFIQKNSFIVWYMPVNSVGGAASSLDFSPLFKLGGYLMSMMTWTIDTVAGIQEYAIFLSSEGEIAMYNGTDPSVAANWSIVGTFRLGRPVGRRCACKIGSDVLVISADGFYPISKALLTDRSQAQDAISNKIVNLINNDMQSYAGNFGWEAILYPIGNKVLINVPQTENKVQYQYVMNTITGAWCRFTGWNANCFNTMGDSLFFGSNLGSTANSAYVAKCDYGSSDNGAYIFGEAKTAFRYFGDTSKQKHIKMIRCVFETAGSMNVAMGMDMDYADNYPLGMPTYNGTAGTAWATGLWNTFPWGDVSKVKKSWQSVSGVGFAGALHLRLVNNVSAVQWQSVDYLYSIGGEI
jgi:hypothetical protein